jgi:RNA polymerase sigma factor (sigma-70 family)
MDAEFDPVNSRHAGTHGRFRDHQSVERLVLKYENWIRRFIRRRADQSVLARTTPDDLYQESVSIALQSAVSFTYCDDARFLAWMALIIARCIWRSRDEGFRGIKFTSSQIGDSSGLGRAVEQAPAVQSTPSSIAHRNDRSARLRQSISRLPGRYRQVLTCYALEQRPWPDVAAELGCSRGAAARLLKRALRRLREEMTSA